MQPRAGNCEYTALGFTIWLRTLRWRRTASMVLPVIFGALATWQIVTQYLPWLAAVLTLLATVVPLVYRASKTDAAIAQFTKLAGTSRICATASGNLPRWVRTKRRSSLKRSSQP